MKTIGGMLAWMINPPKNHKLESSLIFRLIKILHILIMIIIVIAILFVAYSMKTSTKILGTSVTCEEGSVQTTRAWFITDYEACVLCRGGACSDSNLNRLGLTVGTSYSNKQLIIKPRYSVSEIVFYPLFGLVIVLLLTKVSILASVYVFFGHQSVLKHSEEQ